jgi:hypothetical protein
MKKLLTLAVIALVGYVVYQQIENDKADQDLWNEATTD